MCRASQIPAGARVLEIGCGEGNALPALWRHMSPCSLTALDVDGRAVAFAQPRLRQRQIPAQIVIGELEDLPFADDAFDVIVDFGTSSHVNDRRCERSSTCSRPVASGSTKRGWLNGSPTPNCPGERPFPGT
jgi:cyclopropane fatty-acyl-phospholipid synthase-like methyltransferase